MSWQKHLGFHLVTLGKLLKVKTSENCIFRNAYAVIHWRLFQFLTLLIKIMFTKVYCTILLVAFACRGSPWRLWLGPRWKYDSIKSYLHISVTWTCLNIKRTMVEVPRTSWIKLCSSTCFLRNIFTVLRRFIRSEGCSVFIRLYYLFPRKVTSSNNYNFS